MLALVKTEKGVGNIELRDMPEPTPQPDQVLIEVKAAGVCGTDIHIMHDTFPYWPPVILGHEFAGEIVQVGDQVKDWQVGDRVVGEPHTLACGKCYLCRTGNIQICPEKRSPGWGIHGAFAKYIAYPTHLLHRIPDTMTYEQAALVEPTANIVTDLLERAKVEPEDFVVVLGPGPIGLIAAMAARAEGARAVMITGTDADEALRLKTARELGVDHVVNLQQQDPVAMCMELTDGRGADLVVECSGAPPAITSTPDYLRKLGRICAVGLTGKRPVQFDWDAAQTKVLTIYFNMSTTYTSWDRAISMIALGKVNADAITTHVLPLERWEEGFEAIENMSALKVVLKP
ncbi:MAG: alcohol dehydrogenase catalytic domain-containing protein [candidate division WS1 bacterium]|jgi:L-iditol 2-dehydrogenase|nr:alcohol dehydrogenase catalytic domain-containing protein [candidate division WS1 bacterium]